MSMTPDSLSPANEKPLVYDVGMNNGDDVAYYLAKGLRVVAIEANRALCDACSLRFADAIASGELRILHCAVGAEEGMAEFFVSDSNSHISTLVPPASGSTGWTRARVSVRKLSTIIAEQGEPYYVKIDIEQMDHVVLADLAMRQIRPPYISAESHVIDVYCQLVNMGYEFFNLVDGRTVADRFNAHSIARSDGGTGTFAFKQMSAGPFGDDIPWPWLDKNQLFAQLLTSGLGWRDIHATTVRPANVTRTPDARDWPGYEIRGFRENLTNLLPSLARAIKRRL